MMKSCPDAAIRRSRMWAASAGVPIKTIRNGARPASDADGGGGLPIGLALLDHFCEFAPVEFALDAADAIDKQLAVEMIDLVLQRDRQEFFRFDLDFLLLERPRAHQHALGPLHVGREIDHREAPFLPHYRSLGL